MSTFGDRTTSDSEFERSLLESAQGDGPSHETDEAWTRLCVSLTPLQAAAQPEPLQPSAATPSVQPRLSLPYAAACLMLGGLGGALVTALWLGALWPASAPPAPGAPPVYVQPAPSPPAELAQLEPPAPPPSAASGEPAPHLKPAPALKAAPPQRSSLSAEVAALDRAHASLRAGEFAAALRAIDQYQRDFPRGVLVRDAEVIAIDALEGLGARGELQQRARHFLARYPSDPHAARVASLLRAEH